MHAIRCPHCQMLLMEAETTRGACPLCKKSLAPASSGNSRRTVMIAVLCVTLLAAAAGAIWILVQPSESPPAVVAAEKFSPTEPGKPPSSDTIAAKKVEQEKSRQTEVPPSPKPIDKGAKTETREEPKQPPNVPKNDPKDPTMPVVPPKAKELNENKPPEKLDTGSAVVFASKVLRASDLIIGRYHRDIDKSDLGILAVRGLYEAAKEKIPAPIEQRLQQIKSEVVGKVPDLLVDARVELGKRPEFADPKDIEASLKHMLRQLDSNSTVMDAHDMERTRWLQNTTSLGEIGVLVRRQPQSGAVEVRTPYKDGPAYRAGIKAGDVITHFKVPERADAAPKLIVAASLTEDELERILWGPLNSPVGLTVARPGSDTPLEFDVIRAQVKKEKLLGVARRADNTWDYVLDKKRGFYYVRLLDFQDRTMVNELDQLLTDDKEQIKGLVLDLRFSDGGLIETTVRVADLFIDEGLIVEFRWRADGSGRMTGKKKGSHLHFPMTCLVDATSGACTEIVAACLQDYRRAAIIGERTAGKASVQNYFPFDPFVLRLTTSHAYRSNGKALTRKAAGDADDEWGVTPDLHYRIGLSKTERDALREHLFEQLIPYRDLQEAGADFEDRQLDAALDYLRRKSEGEFIFP